MLDCVLRGGQVVDGTGAPARTADVAISCGAGRRPSVGSTSPLGWRSTPTGSWCARGSSIRTRTTTRSSSGIPTPNPSSVHGVTSVIGGQLLLRAGADPSGRRRLHAPHDGPGRGHAARRARAGRPLELGVLRRISRRPRRSHRRERRLHRRALGAAPLRPRRRGESPRRFARRARAAPRRPR